MIYAALCAAVYVLVCCSALLLIWRYLIRRFLCRRRGLRRLAESAVVVTGCDSGFGRLIALRLHDLGATVFAGCMQKQSCEALNKDRKKMRAFLCNVCKDEDVAKCLKLVQESGLPFLALVNNAGISAFGWAESLDVRTYQRNMDVNFFGTVRMTRAFLPLLRKDRGRLINMGSIGARMPSAFGSAYLSTKAAMSSYSESVRQEMHRFGVHVSLIEPGFFATGLLAAGAAAGKTDSSASAFALAPSCYPDYADKMARTATPIRLIERLNGLSCEWVNDAVVDSVVNRFPLARYTVGYDARMIRHILVFIPTWIVDVVQTMQDANGKEKRI
jgi:NAD(P)-dependent dehydrogenase (short-subunit alcohol dehydrogenase family)